MRKSFVGVVIVVGAASTRITKGFCKKGHQDAGQTAQAVPANSTSRQPKPTFVGATNYPGTILHTDPKWKGAAYQNRPGMARALLHCPMRKGP